LKTGKNYVSLFFKLSTIEKIDFDAKKIFSLGARLWHIVWVSGSAIFDIWGAEGGPRDNGDKAVLCGYGQ
jgi:hypothetical protein